MPTIKGYLISMLLGKERVRVYRKDVTSAMLAHVFDTNACHSLLRVLTRKIGAIKYTRRCRAPSR